MGEPNQPREALSSVIESQETIETQTAYQARIAAFDSIVAYVLDALGHAHLYQEEPRKAIACFKQALDSLPEKGAEALRFNLSVGLFYALSDTQEFAEVAQLTETLRLSRAAIARWRGWYEQSRHHLELVQDRNAQGPVEVQRTHLGLDTQDYQAAERSLGIA